MVDIGSLIDIIVFSYQIIQNLQRQKTASPYDYCNNAMSDTVSREDENDLTMIKFKCDIVPSVS